MRYHNHAFTLKSRQVRINQMADLKDKVVVAENPLVLQ
jgi:hypothetical protein